jgi:uncharacterized protein YjhX (UPF0386 family)
MKLKLISETYEATEAGTIKGKTIHIKVEVDGNKRITLTDSYGREGFVFKGSKPEMLVKIGTVIAKIGKTLK